MIRLQGFFNRQAQMLLHNSRYASICAVLLALLPYVNWLSLVVIALITLRKGWQEGLGILVPVLMIYFAVSWVSIPIIPAIINTFIVFLPCYIAACILRFTCSWRAVAYGLFILIFLTALILQSVVPSFIQAQFLYMRAIIDQLPNAKPVVEFLHGSTGLDIWTLANYLFGIQAVSIVLAAIIPIMFARLLQSQLFYPGGFKQEMLTFRGSKIALLVLLCVILTIKQSAIAINILPILLFYFALAGLSLSANALSYKKFRGMLILLIIPLLLLPFVMLPIFIMLGSLDSLFNLRVYFARSVDF